MIDRRMTLVRPLEQLNLKHVFGVPGDYMLRFLDLIEQSDMDLVNTCSDPNADRERDRHVSDQVRFSP
jgi:indolepyruvate decarboxylase